MASTPAAYATYRENVALWEVVKALKHAGLHKEDICLFLSPAHPVVAAVRDNTCVVREKALKAMNLLSELGAALVPTFGFFIRSNKFFGALGLDRNAIPGCGLPGALASLGFSRKAVDRVEGQVNNAGVLMYVACTGVDQTRSALEILRATGAEEAGVIENDGANSCESALATTSLADESLLSPLHS